MPVLISDKDYAEYQVFLNNFLFQQRIASVKSLDSLEFDIDAPIRNLVALFALLGCEPVWSCCGFDYVGQPMHKAHEYGTAFIAFINKEKTINVLRTLYNNKVIEDLGSKTNKWETWVNGYVFLRTDFDYHHREMNYPWTKKSCIHFPELSLIKIHELETALLVLFPSDELLDEITLVDTNYKQKKCLHDWQYPALKDWKINKSKILSSIFNGEKDNE